MGTFRKDSTGDSVEKLCAAGEKLLQEGESIVAEEKFKAAVQIDNNSARAHTGLGRVYYQKIVDILKRAEKGSGEGGEHAQTRGLPVKVLGHQPTVLSSSDSFHFIKSAPLVLQEMETAIKLGKQSPQFHAELGELYVRYMRYFDAERELLHALQDGKLFHAHFWLGMCYRGMQLFPKAIEHFNEAAKLSPSRPEVYYELGSAYYRNRQIADSISCYEKAISLKPDYTDALLNLGTSLVEAGKRSEAIKVYRRFLELEPNSKDAFYLRRMFPEL